MDVSVQDNDESTSSDPVGNVDTFVDNTNEQPPVVPVVQETSPLAKEVKDSSVDSKADSLRQKWASAEVKSTSQTKSDKWGKEIASLMFKGWRMLSEHCPETGDVPLMQAPNETRKYSVATGKYYDDNPPISDDEYNPLLQDDFSEEFDTTSEDERHDSVEASQVTLNRETTAVQNPVVETNSKRVNRAVDRSATTKLDGIKLTSRSSQDGLTSTFQERMRSSLRTISDKLSVLNDKLTATEVATTNTGELQQLFQTIEYVATTTVSNH